MTPHSSPSTLAAVGAGSGVVKLHPSNGRTCGVEITKDMSLSLTELQKFTTTGGLIIGSTSSGNLYVQGVTDANSQTQATITLMATKAAKTVTFLTTASKFNKGMSAREQAEAVIAAPRGRLPEQGKVNRTLLQVIEN